jgi:hypothetical protein
MPLLLVAGRTEAITHPFPAGVRGVDPTPAGEVVLPSGAAVGVYT